MDEVKENNKFIAIRLHPEGWVVLSPWIKTIDGKITYKHHISHYGDHYFAKEMAEHLANELNKFII